MRYFFLLLTYFFMAFSLYGSPFQLPKREVRAVWLTTIGGLDWPRTKAYNAVNREKQKDELRQILDKLQKANFNTVFFQTRIRGTVVYPSAIEPWDDCLTGHVSKSPGYDPLAFAIEECHKRGMQLHAWVVVFPGHSLKKTKSLGKQSMPSRIPSLCMRTNEFWMLNPGIPGTAEYLASLCGEITQNYDVDGIHLDYARYPESSIRYNDNFTYNKYGKGVPKSEWKRNNVTRCVEAIHSAVKSLKPWVWVSCSPIGKYNDLSLQSSLGWNAYATVHQDAQGWLEKGIMDMLVPMMYFQAGKHYYPFALDWAENANGRPIVNGLAAYKLSSKEGDWSLNTIEKEVLFSRSIQCGQAFFRSEHITNNCKIVYDYLKNHFYMLPALTVPMDWQREAECPQPPASLQAEETSDGYVLEWDAAPQTDGVTYNVYCSFDSVINTENPLNVLCWQRKDNKMRLPLALPRHLLPNYAVTAINRYGQESEPVCLVQTKKKKVSRVEIVGEQLCLSPENDSVVLPAASAGFLAIEDKTGSIIKTVSYTSPLYIGDLDMGVYTFRTLEEKGKSHVLGFLFKRTGANQSFLK